MDTPSSPSQTNIEFETTNEHPTQPETKNLLPLYLGIFVTAIILSLLTFLAFTYYQRGLNTGISEQTVMVPTITESPSLTVTTTVSPAVSDWKTYTNIEQGFSIEYPNSIAQYEGEWEVQEFETFAAFRPSSMKEDYLWTITMYTNENVEDIASKSGTQFPDRNEVAEFFWINGKGVNLHTITTESDPDWHSETVYVRDDNKVFAISNGAVKLPEFERFYKSFRILR